MEHRAIAARVDDRDSRFSSHSHRQDSAVNFPLGELALRVRGHSADANSFVETVLGLQGQESRHGLA